MSAHLDPRVLARLKRDSAGLFPAIAQQYDTGEVLMLGWMDDRALHSTLTTGRCTYFSRSRQEYWVKGDTSGHVQLVKSVALDCDADTVLVQVDQSGGACHTGARTCFDDDVLLAEGLTDSAGMAVASVDEAIARMQSIDDTVGPRDGVGRFNRMYLEVTRSVRASLHQGLFFGPEFVARLDVALANLYFEAVAAEREPTEVPLAWRPLVEQRDRAGIEPIQFALAGVSAHISHDLPLAVVSVCAELETEPSASPHRRDCQKVVELLDAAEQSIRRPSESQAELSFDRHLAAVKNVVGNWSTGAARDLAWTNALLLWRLRDDAAARALFTDGLANAAALAGRLLLAAV